MSKVASITISARPRSASYETSPTSPNAPKNGLEEESHQINDRQPRNAGITSSDSEEDRHIRRRGSSSSSSPERRRVTSQRNYDAFDQERGLIHAGRSGKMSSRQRTLERELNTEDPSFIASSDDALASSDDGLEDNFIPRKESGQFYHVKTSNGSDNDNGGSIYEKKNIEPPRAKSEPAGRRVKSATGKLLDNYAKDQSFDSLSEGEREIEKPKTSISILKAAYNQQAIETKPVDRYKVDEELEQIRYTMHARGMMEDNDSDEGMKRQETEAEVLYRKPLSSIKDRFFAAASGRRVRSSSESEDDAEEGNQKEEVVAPPQKVTDMKNQWQSKGSWEDKHKDYQEDIVALSQSVFKMKSQWQQPPAWQYEVSQEVIITPPQSVSEMKSLWQQQRAWEPEGNKVEIINPPQSVFDMKTRWLQPHSWESKVDKEEVLVSKQSVVDMTHDWQKPRCWDRQESKEDIVLPQESVIEIKQNWPLINILEEDDGDKENSENVLAPPKPVVEMKDNWQEGKTWIDEGQIDAREEIDTSQVGSARNVFKGLENRRDVISNVNRPRVNKIADPKQIMEARRQKTYGDVSEVDGIVRHEGQDELASVEFDVNQIKAAKHTFKTMEATGGNESKGLRRPSMKLIRQEDVRKTMDDHRRKVTAEDFDDYADHIKLDHQRDAEPYTNGDTVQQQEA